MAEKKTSVNYSSTREGDTYVLLDRLQCPEIYVDGVSQVLIGYPMLKLNLHTVVESSEKEIRKAAVTLTMDTPSAIEIALAILRSCKNVETGLLEIASVTTVERLKELLARIPNVDEIESAPVVPHSGLKKTSSTVKKVDAGAKSSVADDGLPTKTARKVIKKPH